MRFLLLCFRKNNTKKFFHINAGRRRAEDSGHKRRDTEDDRMEDVSEVLVEEEDMAGKFLTLFCL